MPSHPRSLFECLRDSFMGLGLGLTVRYSAVGLGRTVRYSGVGVGVNTFMSLIVASYSPSVLHNPRSAYSAVRLGLTVLQCYSAPAVTSRHSSIRPCV